VDQVAQRFLRSAAQLTTEQLSDQPTPPPGREMEVSIEADEGAAFRHLSQRGPLKVRYPQGQVGHPVDPAMLRVDVADIDADRPRPTETTR
jgi:hypothetical protein